MSFGENEFRNYYCLLLKGAFLCTVNSVDECKAPSATFKDLKVTKHPLNISESMRVLNFL